MRRDPKDEQAVDVPYTHLSLEALRGLVEEFVTREGTDYGLREKTLEEKIADVMRQIERGEARIVFDLETQTANILPSK